MDYCKYLTQFIDKIFAILLKLHSYAILLSLIFENINLKKIGAFF